MDNNNQFKIYSNMKKFLLLVVAVVTCMSVKAIATADQAKIENGILYVYGSTGANSFDRLDDIETTDLGSVGSRDYSQVHTLKFVGDFTSGFGGHWWNSDSNEPTQITTIDMSDGDFSGDNPTWSLKDFNNLEEVIFPKAGKITVIPSYAFDNCAIKTIKIPGYIRLIKSNAFNQPANSQYLETVIFQKYPENETITQTGTDSDGKPIYSTTSQVNMQIETQAFQNCYGLYDVYIETYGTITAANNAFPYWVTYAHTDANRRLGTLHFPEEKTSAYANPHELTESDANDDGRFQAWLQAHATYASNVGNGWFEWVSNAPISNYDPEPFPKFLKTFSHPTLSFIMGEGIKAYIVNGITKNGKTFTVSLKKVNVIPAGTGVILYGEANATTSEGKPTYALTTVNYTGPGAYIRGGRYSADWTNLLEPTSPNSDHPNYIAGEPGVDVEPYYPLTGTVEYRNFGLGYFSKTVDGEKYYAKNGKYGNYDCSSHDPDKNERQEGDFVGFFRMKRGSHIAPRKAYLQLTASEYDDENGGEVIVSTDENTASTVSGVKKYQLEIDRGSGGDRYLDSSELVAMNLWQTAVWEKDWGVRDFGAGNANMMVTFSGEPATDGIKLVITPAEEAEDGAIYNLQGVEVTNPTKGVYIKNGKKFVVK